MEITSSRQTNVYYIIILQEIPFDFNCLVYFPPIVILSGGIKSQELWPVPSLRAAENCIGRTDRPLHLFQSRPRKVLGRNDTFRIDNREALSERRRRAFQINDSSTAPTPPTGKMVLKYRCRTFLTLMPGN